MNQASINGRKVGVCEGSIQQVFQVFAALGVALENLCGNFSWFFSSHPVIMSGA